MFKNRIFLGLFTALLLIPLASNSEAVLWDLQIQANVENSPIFSGERPIVTGTVIDHASKPVPKATINVKSESISITTHTSQSGEFRVELGKYERLPGNYIVTISASTDKGDTGISTIQYQVKGELSPTSATSAKLATPEAKKYLEASPEDFDKNPIGFMLYNYYQKLNNEYLEEQKISEKISEQQEELEKQYKIEQKLREKAIEEYNPGAGIFSGPQYDNYVNSLDENVRDVVVEHLNFTKNLVYEAQIVREEVLKNGGTAEEAQKAYLEKISTSRDMIENLGSNSTETSEQTETQDIGKNSTKTNTDFEESSSSLLKDNEKTPILVNVDGTIIEVDYKESVFFVEINGKVLQFTVEDEKIIQINDS
ncbi:MAG: carboxypeptidase-like regulatory domain-containing protein [Nitrosopumilaceae archaeon]